MPSEFDRFKEEARTLSKAELKARLAALPKESVLAMAREGLAHLHMLFEAVELACDEDSLAATQALLPRVMATPVVLREPPPPGMSFQLSAEQVAKFEKWAAGLPDAEGGFEFCFSHTGIGLCAHVKSRPAGAELDLTDYASW